MMNSEGDGFQNWIRQLLKIDMSCLGSFSCVKKQLSNQMLKDNILLMMVIKFGNRLHRWIRESLRLKIGYIVFRLLFLVLMSNGLMRCHPMTGPEGGKSTKLKRTHVMLGYIFLVWSNVYKWIVR